jgi:hypothetical protein
MRFPDLSTRDLNGRDVTLPAAFEGQVNVVLVAYTWSQQAEVDTWLPALRAREARIPALRTYELPVVGEMSPGQQRRLDGWMRQGITDPATRARTLTLYVDRAAFRASLGIPTERTIALLVVNPLGEVVWQGLGAYDDRTARALDDAVASALSPVSRSTPAP